MADRRYACDKRSLSAMREDPTNDTVGAQCKQRALFARTCKETILFARTCGNRYSHEDMQGTDTPCEDVWGTIPPRVIPTGDTVGPSERHTLVTNKGPREVRAVIPSQVIQGASSLVRMSLRKPGTSNPNWRYSWTVSKTDESQKETATRKPEG